MLTKLLDTQLAFDSVARDYDGPSGNNSLVQRIRTRTMAAVTGTIRPGGHLLDLGCGTGIDAQYLAQAGYKVTAIDWSNEMVKHTQDRITQAGLSDKVSVLHLGIHELDQLAPDQFDGAYSDLGALNCVPDMEKVASSLDKILTPGGALIASVIGRIVPWEILFYTVKGDPARARFRFSPGFRAAPLNGQTVWTRYYSPREFEKLFTSAGFEIVSVRALGLLLPPPYLIAFAQRHPGWIDVLQKVEDRTAAWPLAKSWGDHFLVVMKKHD